jgi:hypothetical protein
VIKIMSSADLYAGLSGIDLSGDSFDLGEGLVIRSTYAHIFAPFTIAFAPAPAPGRHHPGPWASASGGVSYDIKAELFIPANVESRYDSQTKLACVILFLLRIGINPAITLPVFSNRAFSTKPSSLEKDVIIQPFEVQPRIFPLGIDNSAANADSLSWVRDRWQVTNNIMTASPEFTLAVDALDKGQFIQNTALTLVSLWGALEALFSPNTAELRFRVSALIAAFLAPPGVARQKRQKEIAKLYDKRSAAAHGKPKHSEQHLLDTFNLVREVLIKIIERGSVPTADELDEMLFGV